jgi:hypothetical protein
MTQSIPNQLFRGMVSGALEQTWGAEWINLSSKDQANILLDFMDDKQESTVCSPNEYLANIHKGNLQAYADTIAHNYK